MSEPRISVIVPSYNRADVLGLTLDGLAHQSLPQTEYEVFVVDDGSNDGSDQIITLHQNSFRLTCLRQTNRGPAAARNLGATHATAPVLLFVDSDVIPDRFLLERHLARHANNPDSLVVGRVMVWPSDDRPWYDRLINPDTVGMDYGALPREVSFFHALAGNLSVPRTLFVQLGGFDEELWCFEETELAYRASQRNWPLLYQHTAVGYHYHLRTVQQRCSQQRARMRPIAHLLAKHSELQQIIPGVDPLMPLWHEPYSARSAIRRARASLLGTPISRAVGYSILTFLDRRQMLPRFTSIIYWRLMQGWAWVGLHEGLRMHRKSTAIRP